MTELAPTTAPAAKPASAPLLAILKLRILVGYLGEQRQFNWWDCSFLGKTGQSFLEVTFPRTAAQAAVRSTSQAARSIHDTSMGRVGLFHLFRFPVDKEDLLQSTFAQIETLNIPTLTSTKEAALTELAALMKTGVTAPAGPVQIGVEKSMFSANAVSEMAAHYHSAFTRGIKCFPYFSGEAHGRG